MIFFKIVFVTSFFFMLGCNDHPPAATQPTQSELSEMNKNFAKALNAKDAEAAANLYDENGVLLPPNEKRVTGRMSIKKYWQAAIDSGVTNVSVISVSTGGSGEIGYEEGKYHLDFNKNGKTNSEEGRYIEILKKNADGKWRSIYGIWNSDLPKQ